MIVGRRAPIDRTPRTPASTTRRSGSTAPTASGWGAGSSPAARPQDRPWCSCTAGCGTGSATSRARSPVDGQVDVDFLPAAKALHDAGYHVLLFDLRNHGEIGPQAADHLRAAGVQRRASAPSSYLRARPDVDSERIGAPRLPRWAPTPGSTAPPPAPPVKAILADPGDARDALQPRTIQATSSARSARTCSSRSARSTALLGAPALSDEDPAVPAAPLEDTVVQYVQATGDQWGDMNDTEDFVGGHPATRRWWSRYDGGRALRGLPATSTSEVG